MDDPKLTDVEAEGYWRRLHSEADSDLQAVCFPDKSALLNGFFDRIQKHAVSRAMDELGIGGMNASVLEVGCGRGRWLRFFHGRGARVTGVDLSPDAVAQSTKQGFSAVVGHADNLPFDSESFDLVVSITVLLHLPPDQQVRAAKEMERVCRVGGGILLLEGVRPDSSPHVWSRSERSWIGLFGRCRLVFAESHYYAMPLRLLWGSRLIWRAPGVVRRLLEDLAVCIAWPLEFTLMHVMHRHESQHALQGLLVFRKQAEAGRASDLA